MGNILATSSQAEGTTNAFQQRLLRTYMLNVKWQKYGQKLQKDESCRMEYHYPKRGLKWFGRVIRVDNSTPGKRMFDFAIFQYQGLMANQYY